MTIIARIKGGLGNQMFCYAMARSLSLRSNKKLILDTETGFVKDKYKREYSLSGYALTHEIDTNLPRYYKTRRKMRLLGISKCNSWLPLSVKETSLDFNSKFMNLNSSRNIYLDGYWQSVSYFTDHQNIIRSDFTPLMEKPKHLLQMERKICSTDTSVSVHFRFFDTKPRAETDNVSLEYYQKAFNKLEQSLAKPTYYVFSDQIDEVRNVFGIPAERFVKVTESYGDLLDLWLMSKCGHAIIANSTFSWWAAWLVNNPEKIVIAPAYHGRGVTNAWGHEGLLPDKWLTI